MNSYRPRSRASSDQPDKRRISSPRELVIVIGNVASLGANSCFLDLDATLPMRRRYSHRQRRISRRQLVLPRPRRFKRCISRRELGRALQYSRASMSRLRLWCLWLLDYGVAA